MVARRRLDPILDSDWIGEDPAASLAHPKPQYLRKRKAQSDDGSDLALPPDRPSRDSKYRAFVRSHGCYIRGKANHRCLRTHDCAHVEGRGTGTKADDHLTIDLCRAAHMEQHAIGWKRFEAKYGIDRYARVEELLAEWEKRFERREG